jgi:hypothetical protein
MRFIFVECEKNGTRRRTMRKYVAVLVLGLLFLPLHVGAAWTTKRLTYNSGNSIYPGIIEDANKNLHVIWYDNTPGNNEIFYKKSTDGGTTWITKRLTYNSGSSLFPAITADSNSNIHVVWQDTSPSNDEIYYKKSADGGTTWKTRRLTFSSGESEIPAIAVESNDHIHVVYDDDTPGNSEVYYKKSTDGGATWRTKRLTWNSGSSYSPVIALDSNGLIHVLWYDYTPGNAEIYYRKSTDGGTTWTIKRLTYNSGYSWNPAIAIDTKNYIHATWGDETLGNFEQYYGKSTNGGATWTSKRLTFNYGSSSNSTIATDSNNDIHVTWGDDSSGNYEIYYKMSTDGGASWTIQRLTYSSGLSASPSMAVDSVDHLHVVWRDNTPGNYEIYYKKN